MPVDEKPPAMPGDIYLFYTTKAILKSLIFNNLNHYILYARKSFLNF